MALTLAAALAIDQLAGEWPRALHPVVWIGKLISVCERLAPHRGKLSLLVAGAVMAAAIPMIVAVAGLALLRLLEPWPIAGFVLSVFLLKSSFALGALGSAADEIVEPLDRGDLDEARFQLRALCSRDASEMEASDLAGATVESIAENTSDSFVAPVMYAVLFGVGGALFYRAANTLDAMVGYRRGHHEYLGKAAARLDDLLNYVPARVTALLLLGAGALRGAQVGRGWRVLVADGGRTSSPNAGRPMAAMAGLLGVELEKRGEYLLGAPGAQADTGTIRDAWHTARLAGLGFGFGACLLLGFLYA